MIFGIISECQFYKTKNRDANSRINVFLCTGGLKNSQAKKRKKMVTQVLLLIERCTTIELRIFRISSRRNLHRFYGRAQKVLVSIRQVRFSKATLRHANIRESKGPSLGVIHVKNPHQRNPYDPKFEDRSQEETETRAMRPRRRGDKPRISLSSKKGQSHLLFTYRSVEFAGMHMVSRRDLNSTELETERVPKSQTMVVTASGEVQKNDEATVYVKELDSFVTVSFLKITPTALCLRKLCEDH